jgi:hypothetical protein
MLVQSVSISDDRRVEAEAWHTAVLTGEVMEAPQLLFGSVTEMIEQLQAHRRSPKAGKSLGTARCGWAP